MDRVGRASTPTRSTILACTFPAGSAPSCPKQHWGLKRSPGTPTLTPAPGEVRRCRKASSTPLQSRSESALKLCQSCAKLWIFYFNDRNTLTTVYRLPVWWTHIQIQSFKQRMDGNSNPTCFQRNLDVIKSSLKFGSSCCPSQEKKKIK